MIFAIAGGILLALFILRMIRLVPYILVILAVLYLIGSVMGTAHSSEVTSICGNSLGIHPTDEEFANWYHKCIGDDFPKTKTNNNANMTVGEFLHGPTWRDLPDSAARLRKDERATQCLTMKGYPGYGDSDPISACNVPDDEILGAMNFAYQWYPNWVDKFCVEKVTQIVCEYKENIFTEQRRRFR